MSFYTLTKAITDRWSSQWGNTTPTAHENTPFSPSGDSPWVRLAVRDGGATQVSLGPQSRDRHSGIVYVQVFVPARQGEERGRWLASKAAAVFRKVDVVATQGVATFRVPYVYSVDVGEEDWWQLNVVCPYTFDEVT